MEKEFDEDYYMEKFMDIQEKLVWAYPRLLGPNTEHVVTAMKRAAIIAHEDWGWYKENAIKALRYADAAIHHEDEDWDIEEIISELFPE